MTGEADKKKSRISHAAIDWGGDGVSSIAPRSLFFDDIYFSGDGPAETQHVFLDGNELPARFANTTFFSIGELGFGTGLNFLVAWDAWWKVHKPAGAKLRFLSTEKFPLSKDDLRRALQQWPEFKSLSDKLLNHYPPATKGLHRLDLDPDVSLTLAIGDAAELLSVAEGGIDAWFLDGFAPSKNPEMWRPEIFTEMARLSNLGATYATFTVAGAVRRGLSDAGFSIEKCPGFGRKREMLCGVLGEIPSKTSNRFPWFSRSSAQHAPGATVAIIGGGIAGASLAYELRRAGLKPTVFEKSAPGVGASGNIAGLIMPRLDMDDAPLSRFYRSAYFHCISLLTHLNSDHGEVFNPCGVHQLPNNDAETKKFPKLLDAEVLPGDWMHKRDDGLLFPQGGVVNPPAFVKALLGDTPIIIADVREITREQNGRMSINANGATHSFDAVVIANGGEALRFAQSRTLPLIAVAGQVDFFSGAPQPDEAIVFGPYLAPVKSSNADESGLILGAASYKTNSFTPPAPSTEATIQNIEAVKARYPAYAGDLTSSRAVSRASVRCQTPDRAPVVGGLPDWAFYAGAYDGLRTGLIGDYPDGATQPGLFILTGLGSRGLVTAPLLAAMIAAEMTGEPSPVDHEVAEALHPARFFIRALKRTRTRKTTPP